MELVTRNDYAQKVESWLGKGQILVLVGQRRIGKSCVLKDFMLKHRNDSNANIIYVDKEKKEFDSIKNYTDLNCYIDAHYVGGKHNYILVDEIQDIAEWERSLRSYRSEDDVDIIITGSNARMLSADLSTLLSGRYQEIHVHGLSYSEFLLFHQLDDSDESLFKYLKYGGLPGLRQIGIESAEQVYEYLNGVLNTVVLKDVIERYTIRNVLFMNNLLRYLSDNTGKFCSANNISNYMKSQGYAISTNIVVDYASYFESAYLIGKALRYDIHGKKILETNGKYYFEDIGLRNVLAGIDSRENDIEKVIENVVYSHLLRMGYDVKVGQLQVGEVDFVCTKATKRVYVQVSYLIESNETKEREFGTLQNIRDNFPKYVISMSPLVYRNSINGVIHLSLRDFLINGFVW
ncbi:MAG: ATP-binding protein [Bacteroidales bacterium]|nr:ATP-binding protein [Bacteroidales bacterium]